jgi:conjugative relaxase-like TrwC/TraI family protein
MIASHSAGQSKAYFSDALTQVDYYLEGQEINGSFQGKLADRLGLGGIANKAVFDALCDNMHPHTGKPLTLRTVENRRIGYDINFHVPKSVSVVNALSKDNHILEAFRASVAETMLDIEADCKTRVRKKGAYADRNTGEMIWVDFLHQTSRPVENHTPDPHLHAHCFVFNATWDETEKQIKAGEFGSIKRDMPYYQALFHKRFADKLEQLGYQIERTDKFFELAGVPKRVIELFSKRTDEIVRVAKGKGITSEKELDGLGARTRSAKEKNLTMAELKADWLRQIRDGAPEAEVENDLQVRYAPKKEAASIRPQQCADYALDHCFERASVMPYRRLLATALRHGTGNVSVSAASISKAMETDSRIIKIQQRGQEYCTTKEVLAEERSMVNLARRGKGQIIPMYDQAPVLNLEGQQAEAVKHILMTKDRCSIVRGVAGAGKTFLLQEARRHIEAAGKEITIVAPTAQAARGVLREDGFENADTVASLLGKPKQQEQLKGGVLLVDEAGLLGVADAKALLQLAEDNDAQLVFIGDTRQHSSVVRGDALRILSTVADIPTAEVSKIHRQKSEQYRSVVEDLSKGDVRSGFEKLDEMGGIKKIDPLNPHEELLTDYIKAVKEGKSTLIISPTHQQGEEITAAIRERMRQAKMIGKKEINTLQLKNRNLTEAEKSDWRQYQTDQVVQFNQNLPGIKRGSSWKVSKADQDDIILRNRDGETASLPKGRPGDFDVFEAKEIALSKGDKIRITRNGFDQKEKRLNNGQTLEVCSVSKKGQVVLRNPVNESSYALDQDYGHIAHAHCITSHSAQGKTVDQAFVMQPADAFSATDAKQFYVSVSRAREKTVVYTDDKEALLEHAAEAGDRTSAMELVKSIDRHTEYVHQLDRQLQPAKEISQAKERALDHSLNMDEYEPG